MKKWMTVLLKGIGYVSGVLLSTKVVDSYWYVGLIFGLIVLQWNFLCGKRVSILKAVSFLICSTLIYALVFYIAKNFEWTLRESDPIFNSLFLGIVVGSFLLPVIHLGFLGGNTKKSLLTSLLLIVTYLLVCLVFSGDSAIGDYVVVFSWQGFYLLALFSNRFDHWTKARK